MDPVHACTSHNQPKLQCRSSGDAITPELSLVIIAHDNVQSGGRRHSPSCRRSAEQSGMSRSLPFDTWLCCCRRLLLQRLSVNTFCMPWPVSSILIGPCRYPRSGTSSSREPRLTLPHARPPLPKTARKTIQCAVMISHLVRAPHIVCI